MAEKANKSAVDTAKNAAPQAQYTVGEFARNAEKLFGGKANSDIVNAAFKICGKTSATLSEAKDIVGKFMSKEVK